MSSNTADSFTVPKHSLYSASKGAINTFVRCLAKDCGNKKITINAVAPGGIVTDMFHATAKDYLPNAENMTEQQILDVSLWYSYDSTRSCTNVSTVCGESVAFDTVRISCGCCKCRLLLGIEAV